MGRCINYVLSTAKLSETIPIVRVFLSLSSHIYSHSGTKARHAARRSYQILKNYIPDGEYIFVSIASRSVYLFQ